MANTVTYPRLRVSRTASLGITTSWQTLDFTGTETLNTNTFGIDPNTGLQLVSWDTTNKLFKFNHSEDVNYTGFFFLSTTTTVITTRATLQYRCVIPNGTSPGVDFIFPFNVAGGYADLGEATILTSQINNRTEPIALYANQAMRTNGFYIQIKLSNSLFTLGTCTLNYAAILIQAQR